MAVRGSRYRRRSKQEVNLNSSLQARRSRPPSRKVWQPVFERSTGRSSHLLDTSWAKIATLVRKSLQLSTGSLRPNSAVTDIHPDTSYRRIKLLTRRWAG